MQAKLRNKVVAIRLNEDELHMLDVLRQRYSESRSGVCRLIIREKWDKLGMPAPGLVEISGFLEAAYGDN